MKVNVTKTYIDAGVPRDCDRCPVALAVLGEHAIPVMVGPFRMARRADTWTEARPSEVDLPQRAVDWIRDFDNGIPVEPFSFEVPDLPPLG